MFDWKEVNTNLCSVILCLSGGTTVDDNLPKNLQQILYVMS
jgi:hypothetical protein